jgi:general secretion pathway protein K
MQKRMSLKHQQGVVIVVALFFVALVVSMAALMMSRLERDTHRTQLLLRNTQAEFYAQGAIAWAIEQLRSNLEKQKPDVRVDIFPLELPVKEVNGYKISTIITDMQARFNLNNLMNTDAQKDFQHLLKIVAPQITETQAQEIIKAIVDWILPGQQQNELNKYYMSLSPPYRAAHRAMISVSELRLVKGMSPELYHALEPYVTALPETTLINVQTALAPVIAALSPTMTLETGLAIEKLRAQTVIASTQAFLSLDLVKNHHIPSDRITVVSRYFLVKTTVTIEKQRVVLYTLLDRPENKSPISVVWQSKSVLN